MGDSQLRAQRDINKRIENKRNDPPSNNTPPNNNPGNRSNDTPVNRTPPPPIKNNDTPINRTPPPPIKNNDTPVNRTPPPPIKTNDAPVNKTPPPSIKTNDAPVNKTPPPPIKTNDVPTRKTNDSPTIKTPTPPSIKTNDKPGDKIIDKPVDKFPVKKVDDNLRKSDDKPLDKGGRIDRGTRIGGDKKIETTTPPKVGDKIVTPPEVKKTDDRGNPIIDKGIKNDAFKPGRFDRDRVGKDIRPNVDKTKAGDNTKGTKTGVTPNVPPTGIKADNRDNPNKFGPKGLKSGDLVKGARDVDVKKVREEMNNKRFEERVKSGELDRVTKGEMAKKLDLADQYKNMHKGDVARRMDLQKRAMKDVHVNTVNNVTVVNLKGIQPRPGHYYGHISSGYANHCFKYRYWGPTFFAGYCLYPHWSPWIGWSWHYHCHSMWDPRPLWCRPIIYEPYIVWNYWQPPAWQPLPEASVGTWVDVKPVVVEPDKFDLQLLAVRMVDPGHPEEKLGPRYRIWFRNNSSKPITEPFSVMLFASNDQKFGDDLPRGGVRVTSIEAGDTQSVDIRLPMEVYTMNRDAAGEPAPFNFLHFFVDANREVNDENLVNNGAVVPRDEMLPVDPAAFEIDPIQSRVGGELILAGEGFGPQPGQVMLHIGDQEIQAEIVGWYDLGVKFTVPKMDVPAPTEAEAIVIRGDGAATNPLKITILPDVAEQEGPVLEMPAER
jgi:hypothetical protein